MIIKIFLTLLVLFSNSFFANKNLNTECKKKCNTNFGKVLGANMGTIAYSNCSDKCVSNIDSYIKLNKKKYYTGMKWQCVEYARRWLIENKDYTFKNVKYAYQIWDIDKAVNINNSKFSYFKKYRNNKTKTLPKVGDMLIQDNSKSETGHISIVVSVAKDKIFIAEQNYYNKDWNNKNFSRIIKLTKNKSGFYSLQDKTIIGWMRI